ncbi:hypothetical protein LINPERPRIM_LOCUS8570 [Linum perenne]
MKEYRIPNIVDRKWNGRLRKETIIHRLITQSHIYYAAFFSQYDRLSSNLSWICR